MGDRSTIFVVAKELGDKAIWFYGHYAGDTNVDCVEQVLESTNRVGDYSYLSAQLFHAFSVGGGYEGESGFGIGVCDKSDIDDTWDDNPCVVVDADSGQYAVGEIPEPVDKVV